MFKISEILKKVVPGVHQINRIYTLKYEQDYEPKEKGLDHVTIVRNVFVLLSERVMQMGWCLQKTGFNVGLCIKYKV